MESMPRVQAIWRHPVYQEAFAQLQTLEQDRIFCRHTMAHFLDVARLMYLEVLQRKLPHTREQLYALALLHDIGRAEQYTIGTPHHISGAVLAEKILPECGFSEEEVHTLCAAISEHRQEREGDSLSALLYRWDKASRTCFCCPASQECNWSEEKKNMGILL